MDLGYTVRPVICRIEDNVLTHGFFGSGFLVMSGRGFPYFVTVRHVLTNHGRQLSDMCIPCALGEYEMLPLGQPFTARVEDAANLSDLIVFPVQSDFLIKKGIANNLYPLLPKDTNPQVGDIAVIIGFPHDNQEIFYEENRGEYVPTFMKGEIDDIDTGEQMLAIATPPKVKLTTFDMFSGSPVYAYNDPSNVYLAGIVFQGGRRANRLFALSSRCLYNLIDFYEQK
jgi:hypothetical protein